MAKLYIIISLICFFLLVRYSLIIGTICSYSMVPTLKLGDRVVGFRFWPIPWLRKGHVVIITPLENKQNCHVNLQTDFPWIKRVVAIPGDYINFCTSFNKGKISVVKLLVPPKHFCVNGDAYILENIPTFIGIVPNHYFQAIAFLKISTYNNKRKVKWISRDLTTN